VEEEVRWGEYKRVLRSSSKVATWSLVRVSSTWEGWGRQRRLMVEVMQGKVEVREW
jgi:hypothetical protein